jgi:hypothetical protein
MPKIKNFPKSIWIRLERDGDNDYIISGLTPDDVIEESGPTKVAEYKLVTVKTATSKTILS